ncbi:hypothetical protein BJ912DRAFT_919470 [Pholiota molesta]|nr:hypothetical protein BJ912DRAFT_919470 [Pholiota molesta]
MIFNQIIWKLSFALWNRPIAGWTGNKKRRLGQRVENKDFKFSPYSLDGFYAVPPQDSRRHNHRNYRTDSVYDIGGGYDGLSALQQSDFTSVLNSPWSFSAILRAAEFAANNATSEIDPCLASEPGLDPSALTSQLLNGSELVDTGDEESNWSFEKLSAAAGLSANGNEIDLDGSASSSLGTIADYTAVGAFDGVNESLIWPPVATVRSELPLPLADINMRSLDLAWNMSCVGVNPADILPNSQHVLPVSQSPSSLVNFMPSFDFDLDQSIYGQVLDRHTKDLVLYLYSNILLAIKGVMTMPSRVPRGATRLAPTVQRQSFSEPRSGDIFLEYINDVDQQHLPPVNLGTPVFDAHRGIHIEDLKAKAERYRLRNQGRDYDKRWLISFAGKLTARGELLDEFRCYVTGSPPGSYERTNANVTNSVIPGSAPFLVISVLYQRLVRLFDKICSNDT